MANLFEESRDFHSQCGNRSKKPYQRIIISGICGGQAAEEEEQAAKEMGAAAKKSLTSAKTNPCAN